MATRYVNMDNSAAGDGTTNETDGSADSAFTSLNGALAALGSSTLSEAWTIYCEGSAADTTACTQAVWDFTTSSTNYLEIIGEQSPRHPNFSTSDSGKWTTSKYRLVVTNSDVIYSNTPGHVRIEGLQIEMVVTDTGEEYIGLRLATGNNTGHPIDHRNGYCIVRKTGAGSSTSQAYFNSDPLGAGTFRAYNCLAYDAAQGFVSDGSTWAETNCRYINCTSVDCGFNYVNPQRNINCLSHGAGGGFVSTTATGSSNNASSDDSAVGANARIDQTFTFVNSGADDFHLDSGDAGAKGFGLEDPDSSLFADDVDGGTRSSWDIGFDEEGVAAGGGATIVNREAARRGVGRGVMRGA